MAEAAKKQDERVHMEAANDQRILRDWYTTAQAAQYLSSTPKALGMMIVRGKLRPDHPGGRGGFRGHRFSRATLDAFMKRS